MGGYSVATPLIYFSFLINVWIGRRLQSTESPLRIGARVPRVQRAVLPDLEFRHLAGQLLPHTLVRTGALLHRSHSVLRAHAGGRPALQRRPVRLARVAEPQPAHRRASSCHRLKRALLSWSSGKDSAWALHALRDWDIEIAGLLTTFNGTVDRVAMHAVRHELVNAQAEAAGLPLRAIELPWPCSNARYEALMADACRARRRQMAFDAIVFGDLFLRDIREYRERALRGSGLEPLFPLVGDSDARSGARDDRRRPAGAGSPASIRKCSIASFAGREFDAAFLADLPPQVDPCGENGEFHTFAYDGPMFRHPIPVTGGRIARCGRIRVRRPVAGPGCGV